MDLETLAREWLRRPVASHGPPDQKALPTLAEEREFMVQSLLTMLRSIADQARREGLEAAAMVLCHICRLLTDEVVGGKFGPAVERGPKGNWDHPCLTSVEEFYATCMASPVRALAIEDKERKSR